MFKATSLPLLFFWTASLAGPLPAQDSSTDRETHSQPLFASHEILEVRIVGPIEEIRNDRGEESEYRQTTIHWSGSRDSGSVPARIQTRGNFRREASTCYMPPLRVNFRTGDVPGTLFEGQDRLKLVTHCRDGDHYRQNVFEEYLAYRIYNLLTDESFRVRLARITYEDPNAAPFVRYGFFIEDVDRLAWRLGGEAAQEDVVHPQEMAPGSEAQVALFQYMIGNTDFSVPRFHNVELLELPEGRRVPVPYDFDWAGLVSAQYAEPNESLPIRSVTQRLFRGYCETLGDPSALYARFLAVDAELPALFDELPEYHPGARAKTGRYLEVFFQTIGTPSRAKRNIEDRCRDLPPNA